MVFLLKNKLWQKHLLLQEQIKNKNIPLVIVNSTTDPWIDFERSKKLAKKINAKFISIEKAGHFMEKDGYKEFPRLIEIIEEL